MKINYLLLVILAACTFGFAKNKADVREVTGCLSKGDSANEFLLAGNDESTWEVRKQSRLSPICGPHGNGDWPPIVMFAVSNGWRGQQKCSQLTRFLRRLF